MNGRFAIGVACWVCIFNYIAAADDRFQDSSPTDYYAVEGPGQTQAPAGGKAERVQSRLDAAVSAPCDNFSCCFRACQFPSVYFQADALYWDRVGTGRNDALVIDTDDGSQLLSTDDLDFNGAGGARFLLGWQPNGRSRCWAQELSYWGLYNWNAGGNVSGTGDLAIPGDLGLASNNFFLADTIVVDYRSELHNVEFNCIKSCCTGSCCRGYTRRDFIAGFRYLALNDSLALTATDLQEGTSSYNSDVRNSLYGFQLGARRRRAIGYRCGLELTGKAALFYNDISANQRVTDFPETPAPFVLRDTSSSRDGVATLGEIGAVLIRPINARWNLRMGYTAICLGGVALATDQLDFTDTAASGTGINNTGWIVAHGAVAGLERRW